MILKTLHKYMLIGLLLVIIVLNFFCTLSYVPGPSRARITSGFLNHQKKKGEMMIMYSGILRQGTTELGGLEEVGVPV